MRFSWIKMIGGLLLAMPMFSHAQVYLQRMEEAISQGDTTLQRKVLREWQFEWPDDPDLRAAQSAFYQRKYTLETDSQAKAGYLSEVRSLMELALRDFPDRLDMRLAYISLLGDIGEHRIYTEQLLELLDAHDRLGEDWLWRNNNKLTNVNEFVLQYVDMYGLLLFNRKDETLYPLMDTISNRVLRSYPNHVPALLSLSINALHREDNEVAINYLQKANGFEPTNTSVLDNLAVAYKRIGDRARAIESYQRIEQHGSEQEKEYASRKLEELEKGGND